MANKLKDRDISYILETIDDDEIDLAEIPSDAESIVDDVDEQTIQEIFDNIIAEENEEDGIVEGNAEVEGNEEVGGNEEVYDSEDEVPLAALMNIEEQFIPPKWNKQNSTESTQVFIGAMQGPTDIIENMSSHNNFAIFESIITSEIIEHIVFQTNLYAQQSGKYYIPTNASEIRVFIGINFLMGIKPQSSYRDYWSSRPELNDSYISQLIPVKRFDWILSNLHLNDSSLMPKRGSPEFNKLYKVQPFLDMVQERFKLCFNAGEYLAVDESMIRFKGTFEDTKIYIGKFVFYKILNIYRSFNSYPVYANETHKKGIQNMDVV